MTMLLSAACINKIMHYFAHHFKIKSPLYFNIIPVLVPQQEYHSVFGLDFLGPSNSSNKCKTKRKNMTKNKGKHERKCFLLANSQIPISYMADIVKFWDKIRYFLNIHEINSTNSRNKTSKLEQKTQGFGKVKKSLFAVKRVQKKYDLVGRECIK